MEGAEKIYLITEVINAANIYFRLFTGTNAQGWGVKNHGEPSFFLQKLIKFALLSEEPSKKKGEPVSQIKNFQRHESETESVSILFSYYK